MATLWIKTSQSAMALPRPGLLHVRMPTVLRTGPYRFYFYSHEPGEPPHVHVDRDEFSAKVWLMSTSDREGERVRDVRFEDDRMSVDLTDGRTITVPLSWYPRLDNASAAQRANWRIAGGGFGIHWPDIDEDLSTAGLLRGSPAPGGRSPSAA